MSKKLLLNKGSYNYFVFKVSAGKTIELIDDSYNSITDWGDGSSNTKTYHTYKNGGIYTVMTQHRINYVQLRNGYNSYTVGALIECLGVKKNIDLKRMFDGCANLTNADISSIDDTVRDLDSTFSGCHNLETIIYPKQINISGMRMAFNGCGKLKSIDTSCFNAVHTDRFKVSCAFSGCSSLTSLDLSWISGAYDRLFDFTGMFSGCKSLTSLDLTPMDTCNAGYFTYMFMGCESLTSLNINGWIMRNWLDEYATRGMFTGCKSLTLSGIYMRNCDQNVIEYITNAINNK